MRYLIALLLVTVSFVGCNNAGNKTGTEQLVSPYGAKPTGYYKRYSGTVAGQPVVLQLIKNNRLVQASYYYVKQGKPISLFFMPDSAIKDKYLADEPTGQRDAQIQPQWRVVIVRNVIKGQWVSADRKKTYDINLKEEYPEGSYPLVVWEKTDSIRYKPDRPEPAASVYFQFTRPGKGMQKEDADYLEKILMHELGADSLKTNNVEESVQQQINNYSKWYRETLGSLPDSELGESWNNYYTSAEMGIIMNDSGWLVMEYLGSDYTGGAHGNYGVGYLNIDMRQKKQWKMEDILTVDSAKLQKVLEDEGRRYFNIPAGAKLEESLLADRIIPNGNVYITATGITFVYNPYEIASYADGIITLFIPYAKIKELLKPEFIQRMGL